MWNALKSQTHLAVFPTFIWLHNRLKQLLFIVHQTFETMRKDANAFERFSHYERQTVLEHEHLYLQNLPTSDLYEKSLMHRDLLTFVEVTPNNTDFIITTSVDGHVKFWKKTERGIEFVKHYKAHLGSVVGVATAWDGSLFATVGSDKAVKVFDVVNFGGY
jgi:WD40 repeat protein